MVCPIGEPVPRTDPERLISQADAAISNELRDHIRKTLGMLTPREEQVVRMRFGIGEAHDHPPEEIARQLAVSRQRIFSIQTDALRKLRRPSRQLKPVNRP
jgi:RNA polymerase primary sigma factor